MCERSAIASIDSHLSEMIDKQGEPRSVGIAGIRNQTCEGDLHDIHHRNRPESKPESRGQRLRLGWRASGDDERAGTDTLRRGGAGPAPENLGLRPIGVESRCGVEHCAAP
jgi:hypothetical protein